MSGHSAQQAMPSGEFSWSPKFLNAAHLYLRSISGWPLSLSRHNLILPQCINEPDSWIHQAPTRGYTSGEPTVHSKHQVVVCARKRRFAVRKVKCDSPAGSGRAKHLDCGGGRGYSPTLPLSRRVLPVFGGTIDQCINEPDSWIHQTPTQSSVQSGPGLRGRLPVQALDCGTRQGAILYYGGTNCASKPSGCRLH